MANLNFGKNSSNANDTVTKESQIVMRQNLMQPVVAPAIAAAPPTIDASKTITHEGEIETPSTHYYYCPMLPSMQMHIPSGRNMGIAKTIKFENGVYATNDLQEIKFIELTMKTSGQLIQRTTLDQYERTASANRGIASTMQSSARQFANSDAVRGVRNHNYMEQRAAAAGITPTEEQRKQYAEATRAGDHGGSYSDTPAVQRK